MTVSRSLSLASIGAAIALLSACGGGGEGGDAGGETLAVSFDYGTPDPTYSMWSSMRQVPTLQGLDGREPVCVLAAGTLPAGVVVHRRTCAIEGEPDELGQYSYTVRLTVEGFSGSVTATGTMDIVKPALLYAVSGPLEWNRPWSGQPTGIDAFTARPGYEIGNFRVEDSTLPAGLSIDPQTGRIGGTFVGFTSPRFGVRATIRHAGRSLDVDSQVLEPIALAPSVAYTAQAQQTVRVGELVDIHPPVFSDGSAITSDYRSSFSVETGSSAPCENPQPLPPGLVLNAGSGTITGTPTAVFEGCLAIRYLIEALDGSGVQGWQQIPLSVRP